MKVKSFISNRDPVRSADLRVRCPQPDISIYCETTDTGLMHHVVCLFTFQPKLVLIY